jgi:hypothetical protein
MLVFKEDSVRMLTMAAYFVLAASLSAHAQAAPGQTASNPPAAQQQAAPATATSPQADPQKEADIRRLLKMSGSGALALETVRNSEKNMRRLLTAALPPGAYRQQLLDLFFQKFNSKITAQTFAALVVPIYERHFTDEDVKGLIRFYQTPLGQKFVKTMPTMLTEIQTAAHGWGVRLGRESMREVLAEHPELVKEMKEARSAARGH